ncbi:baculoviral IAP repeat-containing protein 5.2-B-like [Phlebotomus papatasi]|uniref:baculoviral IAP repeat-containing protein 5.2-B-like n=1 Tax=Phlebotomus papatasi TaxID=29031 RepID=UPI0024842203|nr:baculoviral IAP repeat-containing protein 5.2-B-like [Phlebotomus papatasi]
MKSRSESMESNTSYLFEKERLESFKNWDFSRSKTCNEKKMAEAGFFCIGCDSAACFMCGKELDGWEEQDDPWVEHKRHAPQCQFVKNWKKEDDYTVKEFYLLLESFLKNKLEKAHLDDIMKLNEVMDKMRAQIVKNFQP